MATTEAEDAKPRIGIAVFPPMSRALVYTAVGLWLSERLAVGFGAVSLNMEITLGGAAREDVGIRTGKTPDAVIVSAILKSRRTPQLTDVRSDVLWLLQEVKEWAQVARSGSVVRLVEAAERELHDGPSVTEAARYEGPLQVRWQAFSREGKESRILCRGAESILHEEIFWSDTIEWAPHGSDLGSDVMLAVEEWKVRGKPGGIGELAKECEGMAAVDRDQHVIAVALAFGLVKVTGKCPARYARRASQALNVLRAEFGDAAQEDIDVMSDRLQEWM